MRFNHIHSALLLTLGLALAACGKDEAKNTSTTPGDTTTSVSTPTETTPSNVEFTSEAGKFSIKLPAGYGQPKEETQPLPLPGGGSVDLNTFSSSSGDNAAMFSYSDMTGKADFAGKEKAMLDASRDNVLKSMNATLEKEEDIKIGDHPGRRMIFSLPASATETYQGRLEMYVVEPFSYQVMFISKDRAALESADINNYFSSFKLAGS